MVCKSTIPVLADNSRNGKGKAVSHAYMVSTVLPGFLVQAGNLVLLAEHLGAVIKLDAVVCTYRLMSVLGWHFLCSALEFLLFYICIHCNSFICKSTEFIFCFIWAIPPLTHVLFYLAIPGIDCSPWSNGVRTSAILPLESEALGVQKPMFPYFCFHTII